MPPTLAQWLQIPQLGSFVFQTAMPYIVLPLDIIFGIYILRGILHAIRSFRDLETE